MVRGRKAISAMGPELQELAKRCGQTGEADQLAYFLSKPDALKKVPCLLLMTDAQAKPADGKARLEAAVLLFEYKSVFGLGLRVFSSSDGSGRRNVLAPAEARAQVAGMACRALLERGAQLIHLAFDDGYGDGRQACWCEEGIASRELPAGHAERELAEALAGTRGKRKINWAAFEHEMPLYLKLEKTYDATLARIGARTRSNLRYYRRRSELELGCHFVAEARVALEELVAFNGLCTFAVSEEEVRRRFGVVGPGFFLCGIKDGEGDWLALLGGRKQNGFVEIDWQMNRADLPHLSLSTVMRAYLMEYEIGRGSRRLYFEGSTAHPIVRSFTKGRVMELTVKRDTLYVRLLERFASVVFPQKNYLAQMLGKSDLVWRTGR